MKKTTVVNKKVNPDFDVDITRSSKWGNPFRIGPDGTRKEVIAKYREWITKGEGSHLLRDLFQLRGKRLGCVCKPQACHGDILVELVHARRIGFIVRNGEKWNCGGIMVDDVVKRVGFPLGNKVTGMNRRELKRYCDEWGYKVERYKVVEWKRNRLVRPA